MSGNVSRWRQMTPDEQREWLAERTRRLGAVLDEVDEQTREPGEPSLRSQVAAQARQARSEDFGVPPSRAGERP